MDSISETSIHDSVPAICPSCNKEIDVDPSEEVVFCDFCNKAFKVKNAIALYTEHVEREKAAIKPSDEAIKKFNAILEQDYELACTYIEDIIKKEYPSECHKYLIYKDTEYYNNSFTHNIQEALSNNRVNGDIIISILSVNRHIAKMYYQVLCVYLYQDEDFIGGLAFLLLNFENIIKDLDVFISHLNGAVAKTDKNNKTQLKNNFKYAIEQWKNIANKISGQREWRKYFDDEYDDEYIDEIIYSIKQWASESEKYRSWNSSFGYTRSRGDFIRDTLGYIEDDEIKYKSLDELITDLETFYSPAKKIAIKEQREAERKILEAKREAERKRLEKERSEKEQKYQQAFEKEVEFWHQYIDLLKAGKAKKAMQQAAGKLYKSGESKKFKKGLFGVKYLGDISLLNAYTLAAKFVKK